MQPGETGHGLDGNRHQWGEGLCQQLEFFCPFPDVVAGLLALVQLVFGVTAVSPHLDRGVHLLDVPEVSASDVKTSPRCLYNRKAHWAGHCLCHVSFIRVFLFGHALMVVCIVLVMAVKTSS